MVRVANTQYRPLFCHGPGPGDLTLLVGALEKGDRFEPQSAPETALRRKADINIKGRTCEHDFS
jgi:hypothetical protein